MTSTEAPPFENPTIRSDSSDSRVEIEQSVGNLGCCRSGKKLNVKNVYNSKAGELKFVEHGVKTINKHLSRVAFCAFERK